MVLFFVIWHQKGRCYMFAYESLTVYIWKIPLVRAGVEGAGVNLGPV